MIALCVMNEATTIQYQPTRLLWTVVVRYILATVNNKRRRSEHFMPTHCYRYCRFDSEEQE